MDLLQFVINLARPHIEELSKIKGNWSYLVDKIENSRIPKDTIKKQANISLFSFSKKSQNTK